MALVQEMALKIDQGFLAAVLAVVTPSTESRATSGQVTPWFSLLFHEPRNILSFSYHHRHHHHHLQLFHFFLNMLHISAAL